MRNLMAFGVAPDAAGEQLPALSLLAEQAVACWNFCDGWAPERWPLYAALYPVDDWYGMAELMRAIRDQQRAQPGGKP